MFLHGTEPASQLALRTMQSTGCQLSAQSLHLQHAHVQPVPAGSTKLRACLLGRQGAGITPCPANAVMKNLWAASSAASTS